MKTDLESRVRLVASPGAWIEGEALRQFCAAARLEGVRWAVGFPNLQPGQSVPLGAAFVTQDRIYPHLVGGDVGCGMSLWQTNLPRHEVELGRWARLRFDLEHPWEGNVGGWLQDNRLPSTSFDQVMGTIGGGSHFAELQVVERVRKLALFAALGLRRDQVVALIHSGSRGLGHETLWDHFVVHRGAGLTPGSATARHYLRAHDLSVRWAKANRELIAHRFLSALGAEGQLVWDGCHNSITRPTGSVETRWIHRKGAVAAEAGAVLIPGSCGSLSYLVVPIDGGESRAWSLPHGAGRKWSRSVSRLRARERHRYPELVQTAFGGRVICEPRDRLYEEAPMAYKPIDQVVGDLAEAGLVEVIATFRPILTYKTRSVRR